MTTGCELANRNKIRAFRTGRYVLIVAEGDLPTPGYTVDIVPSMLRIFPQQYELVQCARPGGWPQVITPYVYGETVPFPQDQPVVTVHHAQGSDEVTVEEAGAELAPYSRALLGDGQRTCPPGADEATGFSKRFSFDEAFQNALANLPPAEPSHPDALQRVEVVEIGGLFGGVAGFRDLFVRVCRTTD